MNIRNLHRSTVTVLLLFLTAAQAQIKIGENIEDVSPYSLLELESTNKGLLIPRMSTEERDRAFGQDTPEGIVIFNTDAQALQYLYFDQDPITGKILKTKSWNSSREEIHTEVEDNPNTGDLYYNMQTKILYIWDTQDMVWYPLNSGVGATNGETGTTQPDQSITVSSTTRSFREVIVSEERPSIGLLAESLPGLLYAHITLGHLYMATDTNNDGKPNTWRLINKNKGQTNTNLVQNPDGSLSYTNESGAVQSARIRSFDVDNFLILGTDGGIKLDSSTLSSALYTVSPTLNDIMGFYQGTASPTLSFPVSPSYGDIFVDRSTGNLYNFIRSTNSWSLMQNNNNETITDLTDNGDGTFTYTNEAGNSVTVKSGGDFTEAIIIATDGQLIFSPPTPLPQNNLARTQVYRNGIRVAFSVTNTSTLVLETEAQCYQNDEVRIVQFSN